MRKRKNVIKFQKKKKRVQIQESEKHKGVKKGASEVNFAHHGGN
jgi:hypothetical protein